MASTGNQHVLLYYNGTIVRNNTGVLFESDENRGLMISSKITFARLKKKIEEKLKLGVVSDIIYRLPVVFGSGGIERFESLKIRDDEDVECMFSIRRQLPTIFSIELYVTFENRPPTHTQHISPQFNPHQTSPQLRPHLASPQFRPEFQPSSSTYVHYTQFQSQKTSHFHSQPSSSTYAPYTQFQSQKTSHFQSQPSSSTYAPHTRQEDRAEPITPEEEVGDESENESDHVAQLSRNDDDDNEDEDEESQPVQQPSPLRAAHIPPAFMCNIDLTTIDQDTLLLEQPSPPLDGGIEVGMRFHEKEDCVSAIRQYHIKQSLDYVVKQSDLERYVIKCVHPQCNFGLRVSYRKRSGRWVIGRISGSHSCTSVSLSQNHRKLDSKLICDSIVSLLHNDLSVKVKDIIAHIREKFNYTTTYRKAWIAKNKAIEKIYGNWEQSYHDLPHWLMVMRQYLPGTVTQMETLPAKLPDGSLFPGNVIFHRLFWAFNRCIEGFAYCKPIVQVDGTWLNGKYKGTLLIAIAQDGDNNIFPIAFAVVEGETKDAWSFFLKNLRRHVTPQPGICLISNMNPSLKSAYDNPENGWNDPPSTHVYCIRHIAQTFMRDIQDKKLRKGVVNMGYAINESLFRHYRDEIRLNNLEALRWVDNIPRQKWTQAYDGGCRWGHMTTNLSELLNSVLKDIRNQPITALVQATYYSCGPLIARRGRQLATMLDSGQDYTEACMNHITCAVNKAKTHQVVQVDRLNDTFLVRETVNHEDGRPMSNFKVNLHEKWCECGKFQALHLPCSHVIAACSSVHQTYQAHISDVYKVATVFRIYDKSFQVIEHKSYWPPYEGDKLWVNPEMKRIK